MEVEVVRSARRRRSVEARLVDGVLRVSIPAWMSKADESRAVDTMVEKFTRRRASVEIDLVARANVLARRYRLPRPDTIRWSENQRGRWGSCTPADRSVRISSRLASLPQWVLDYVIVHELAHLVVIDHGPDFRALEARYPKAERATGYLQAIAEAGAQERRRTRSPRAELAGQAGLFD
jgi:predicted metal-dependent hydrolase